MLRAFVLSYRTVSCRNNNVHIYQANIWNFSSGYCIRSSAASSSKNIFTWRCHRDFKKLGLLWICGYFDSSKKHSKFYLQYRGGCLNINKCVLLIFRDGVGCLKYFTRNNTSRSVNTIQFVRYTPMTKQGHSPLFRMVYWITIIFSRYFHLRKSILESK